MRVFQFLEICVPWSLECWVWEFAIVVFQVCVGSPGWRGWRGPPPPQRTPPRATHRWRSTVCSASVLRRKWGGAAGSRGGPGPVGGQGRLRLGSPSSRPSDLLRRNGPALGSPRGHSPPCPRAASPPSKPSCVRLLAAAEGAAGQGLGEPGATFPTSVRGFQSAPEAGFGWAALPQTGLCPGSWRDSREVSRPQKRS